MITVTRKNGSVYQTLDTHAQPRKTITGTTVLGWVVVLLLFALVAVVVTLAAAATMGVK